MGIIYTSDINENFISYFYVLISSQPSLKLNSFLLFLSLFLSFRCWLCSGLLLTIFNQNKPKKVVRRRKKVPDSKNELAVVAGEIPPRTGESDLGSIGKLVRPPPPPILSEQVNSGTSNLGIGA